jgi:hypothetical protein
MLYEIPIAGVQVAALVVLAIGSLAATAAICLIEKFQLVEWLWNPPLFFLAKNLIAFLVTGSVLALAGILAWLLYAEYHSNPLTRDAPGRLRDWSLRPYVVACLDQGPIESRTLLISVSSAKQ